MADTLRRVLPEGCFGLDEGDPAGLDAYLRSRHFLEADERVCALSRAGAGNMNCVLRVATDRRTFIAKQSRPWVERYPQFEAPWDRACREMEFYEAVAGVRDVAGRMPRLLHADSRERVLLLEDLGSLGDYSDLYRGVVLTTEETLALASFLSALHRLVLDRGRRSKMTNRGMRDLNHAHIFVLPLRLANGLDLDRIQTGLQALAEELKADAALVEEVLRLGRDAYLVDGECLLHGDFFPGSFVRTNAGLRVIDPEFGFPGRPEFDAGVFVAHLYLAGQSEELVKAFAQGYVPPAGFEPRVLWQMAGAEIIRRLLGYAQLPLRIDLAQKRRVLELARSWVLNPREQFELPS